MRSLWAWHNGHVDHMAKDKLNFRDNTFASADIAIRFADVIQTYREVHPDPGIWDWVPIAEFWGAVYAVPSRPYSAFEEFEYPVISVFEGVTAFYSSIEVMVDICIEWEENPDRNEREVWDRLSPHRPDMPGM